MTTPDAPDDFPTMDQQNNPRLPHSEEPPAGESAEEAALRALMHDAVQGLRGSPDALDHLRHAIPVRRQRRKQALVGAAAALLLMGAAVPALIRAAGTTDGSSTTAASVSDSRTGSPDTDGHTLPGGVGDPSGQVPPGPGGDPSAQDPTADGSPPAVPTTVGGTGGPVPDCSSAQLGQGASSAGAPDAGGRVYGWFRVANVSDSPCTVPAGGVVQAVAQGTADPSRIQVVSHTAGDAASGLPAPDAAGPLLLNPGQDYEVAFAWVPDSSGPGGCPVPSTPPATPTATPTATGTTASGTDSGSTDPGGAPAGNSGTAAGGDTPATPAPASIALNHTPAAGAPVVDGPTIKDACAGTVYTTAPLPATTGSPAS